MMAADWPRSRCSERSRRIESSPRGVGYDLDSDSAISMAASSGRNHQAGIQRFGFLGHAFHSVVLADPGGAGVTERAGTRRIAPEREESVGQRLGSIGLDQHTTTRALEHFRERSAPRLYDRDTRRHRFEQKEPF